PPCFAWSPSPASRGRMRETAARLSRRTTCDSPPHKGPTRGRVRYSCFSQRYPEIARDHLRVSRNIGGAAIENERAELHHVGAVGDLQRSARVLFHEQDRYPGLPELADDSENVGDDQRREPEARLIE